MLAIIKVMKKGGKLAEVAAEQKALLERYHSKKLEYEQLNSNRSERGSEYEKS